jgi:hypothetical protein
MKAEEQTTISVQALSRFVELGRDILRTDQLSHNRGRLPKFRGFQPGFMPLKKAKLLIISCYPSFGTLERSPAREAEEKTLGEWRDAGSLEAYRAAYKTFLRDFVNWKITRKYVSRVLEVVQVANDEIAWLDVIKAPLQANSPQALIQELAPRDLPWLHQQIEIVHSASIASHRKHSELPCLIETKQAEGLLGSCQDFYLRTVLHRAEVQPQTHGQTTEQIAEHSKLIGTKLREHVERVLVQ